LLLYFKYFRNFISKFFYFYSENIEEFLHDAFNPDAKCSFKKFEKDIPQDTENEVYTQEVLQSALFPGSRITLLTFLLLLGDLKMKKIP